MDEVSIVRGILDFKSQKPCKGWGGGTVAQHRADTERHRVLKLPGQPA